MSIVSSARNTLLFIVSLLIAAVLAEYLVRLFIPVRNVGPAFTVYDETYGVRLKKNFSAERITPEFTIRFSTNSDGFRGPELSSLASRPVLFLGDSFTMGYGVSDGEEFPALVRKALNEQYGRDVIPVINAGVSDVGNGHWIKFLRTEARYYNPRLVVLQLFENDFSDNVKDNLFALSTDHELVELPVPPISTTRRIQKLVESVPGLSHSYLLGLANQARWMTLQRNEATRLHQAHASRVSHDEDELTYGLVKEAISISEKEGWPVLAIAIGISGPRQNELERIFRKMNIPFVTVPGRDIRPDLYYKVDIHWNRKGHEYMAGLIVPELYRFDISKARAGIGMLATDSL